MATISIEAHFDGSQIILDEPVELEPNAKRIVTVLPISQDDEYAAWTALSRQRLANAYADDEVEYSLGAIKEINPAYEGG